MKVVGASAPFYIEVHPMVSLSRALDFFDSTVGAQFILIYII